MDTIQTHSAPQHGIFGANSSRLTKFGRRRNVDGGDWRPGRTMSQPHELEHQGEVSIILDRGRSAPESEAERGEGTSQVDEHSMPRCVAARLVTIVSGRLEDTVRFRVDRGSSRE